MYHFSLPPSASSLATNAQPVTATNSCEPRVHVEKVFLNQPTVINSTYVGQYCVVIYDEKPYPGEIISVDDDDVKVKCMHSLGRNKFFWPTIRLDINEYCQDDILCIIEEPLRANKRSDRVRKLKYDVWEAIEAALDKNT